MSWAGVVHSVLTSFKIWSFVVLRLLPLLLIVFVVLLLWVRGLLERGGRRVAKIAKHLCQVRLKERNTMNPTKRMPLERVAVHKKKKREERRNWRVVRRWRAAKAKRAKVLSVYLFIVGQFVKRFGEERLHTLQT